MKSGRRPLTFQGLDGQEPCEFSKFIDSKLMTLFIIIKRINITSIYLLARRRCDKTGGMFVCLFVNWSPASRLVT